MLLAIHLYFNSELYCGLDICVSATEHGHVWSQDMCGEDLVSLPPCLASRLTSLSGQSGAADSAGGALSLTAGAGGAASATEGGDGAGGTVSRLRRSLLLEHGERL